MKILKAAGIAVAVILLILVIGVAVIASQFDGARLKSEAEKTVLEQKQRTLKIDGDVRLSFWPRVGVQVGGIRLSEPRSDQEFAAVEAARISVAVLPLLARKVVVDEVYLDGVRVNLVQHKDGTLNIADLVGTGGGPAAPKAPPSAAAGAPLRLDIAGVHVANAALAWRSEQSGSALAITGLNLQTGRIQADSERKIYELSRLSLAMKGKSEAKGGAETFDVRIDAPQITIGGKEAGGQRVGAAAILAGPQGDVTLNLSLTDIAARGDAQVAGKLALDLNAKSQGSTVKGRVAGALSADVGAQTLSLEKIDGRFDVGGPGTGAKPAALTVTGGVSADLAKQKAQGAWVGRLDDSRVALTLAVDRFSPPAFNFNLDVDQLDLDRYLPPAPPAAASRGGGVAPTSTAPSAAAGGPASGGTPIDLSPLKGLTVKGVARARQIQAHNLKVGALHLEMNLANGRLDVAPLTASLYGGSLNGSVHLDAAGNALATRQSLSGIQIAPLLKDLANEDILEGHGDVALNVTAHGATLAAMESSLAGTANMSLRDGAIKGINLAQTFRSLKGRLNAKQDQTIASTATEKTDFSELSASFRIDKGVAHNDDLSVKSPFLRLGGNGDIDIGRSRLDYLLKASVVASAGGQGDKDLEQLKGVTIPVRLTGPFEKPSWKIELAAMADALAKAKVDEAKQKAKGRVQEQLKGLFKH
jgi:AsmA protein